MLGSAARRFISQLVPRISAPIIRRSAICVGATTAAVTLAVCDVSL